MTSCDAVQDAIIDGATDEAVATHLAGCPACRGAIAMIGSIKTELEPVPTSPGQRPQWISELHRRAERRRKRIVLGSSGLAVALGAVALAVSGIETEPESVPVRSPAPRVRDVTPAAPPAPDAIVGRPDWISDGEPAVGRCVLHGSTLSCVGASPYLSSKTDGLDEARVVAMEALCLYLAPKIEHAFFQREVRATYEPLRAAMLDAYRERQDYAPLAATRRRAARLLAEDDRSLFPAFQADWYWEEYAKESGGTEFLVFARYDLSADYVKWLIALYSTESDLGGRRVLPTFPLLAFAFADLESEYMRVDGKLDAEALIGTRHR